MTAATLALLFASMTQTYNLPSGLLGSICYVESQYNPTAVHPDDGSGDSIGIAQIHYDTAVQMGYKGSAQGLKDPAVNLRYASKYLQYQLQRYDGNIIRAIAAYNSGTYKVNKQGLPVNQSYVTKVITRWLKQR